MDLVQFTPEHPLRQRLRTLAEKLTGQEARIAALKQKIVTRLIAWQQPDSFSEKYGPSAFDTLGVRTQLAALIPDFINDDVSIDAHGWVKLQDGTQEKDTHLGTIILPYTDQWIQESFVNRNIFSDVERPTFHHEGYLHYTSPKEATLESNGTFQLTDEDATAARIAMATDYVRGYIKIAQIIHTTEEAGSYRNSRAMLNLQDAFRAVEWLERNLPEEATEIPLVHGARQEPPQLLEG